MIARTCLLGLAATLLGAPLGAQDPVPVDTAASAIAVPTNIAPSEVTVRRGDQVTIEVFGREELSVSRVVDRQGEIHLPYLGSIDVLGLSPEAIRRLVTDRYSQLYTTPLINVEVRVGVNATGELQRPNRYRVDPSATVLDVIAEAGGLTPEARSDRVELVRGGEVIVFSLRDPESASRMLATPVQSGDWIRVPRQRFTSAHAYLAGVVLNIAATVVLFLVGR